MRAMLDAHPDVRCGEETRVIPRILGLRAQWKRSEKVRFSGSLTAGPSAASGFASVVDEDRSILLPYYEFTLYGRLIRLNPGEKSIDSE